MIVFALKYIKDKIFTKNKYHKLVNKTLKILCVTSPLNYLTETHLVNVSFNSSAVLQITHITLIVVVLLLVTRETLFHSFFYLSLRGSSRLFMLLSWFLRHFAHKLITSSYIGLVQFGSFCLCVFGLQIRKWPLPLSFSFSYSL